MKKIIFSLMFLFAVHRVYSQEAPKPEAPKISVHPVGSITISAHLHRDTSLISGFLNFGGPGIRFEYKKFAVSYCMFPSLRLFQSGADKELSITPILGTGLQFHCKKFTLAFPNVLSGKPKNKKEYLDSEHGHGL